MFQCRRQLRSVTQSWSCCAQVGLEESGGGGQLTRGRRKRHKSNQMHESSSYFPPEQHRRQQSSAPREAGALSANQRAGRAEHRPSVMEQEASSPEHGYPIREPQALTSTPDRRARRAEHWWPIRAQEVMNSQSESSNAASVVTNPSRKTINKSLNHLLEFYFSMLLKSPRLPLKRRKRKVAVKGNFTELTRLAVWSQDVVMYIYILRKFD